MNQNSAQIEERLIRFSAECIKLSKVLKPDMASQILSRQFIRSATSSALNYAESRSASSRKDFIHKLKIVAKELRETHVNLRIIKQSELLSNHSLLEELISETNELVAMMVSSIKTLEKNP